MQPGGHRFDPGQLHQILCMDNESSWFLRRKAFGRLLRAFCILPFIVIGVVLVFGKEWKIGLVLLLWGISFVMLEKRWYPKK